MPTLRSFLVVFAFVAGARASFCQPGTDTWVPVPDRNAPRPVVSIGHQRSVYSLFPSPDGTKLFSYDGEQLRAWDTASQKELSLVHAGSSQSHGHFAPERNCMFSISPTFVAVRSLDTLQYVTGGSLFDVLSFVWDSKRDRAYLRYKSRVGELREVNGQWQPFDGQSLRYVDGQAPLTENLILLEDGRLFVDLTEGYAILDPVTWQELQRVPKDARSFQAGPAGSLLALTRTTSNGKAAVQIERLAAEDLSPEGAITLETENLTPQMHPGNYDPESKTFCLLLGSEVIVADFETMNLRDRFVAKNPRSGAWPSALTRLPHTGEWILATGSKLVALDLRAKRLSAAYDGGAFHPRSIVSSPHGFELLASDETNSVKRVRFTSGGIQITDVPGKVTTMAYAPDSESVAFSGGSEFRINVSETEHFPTLDFQLPAQGDPIAPLPARHLFYSADGTLLGSRTDSTLRLVSMTTGRTVFSARTLDGYLGRNKGTVAISPDNTRLVAYSGGNAIMGFDVKTQKPIWTEGIQGPRAGFYFLSPDIFACVRIGAIEYRDTQTGRIMIEAPIETTPKDDILITAISPDTKRVAVYDGGYVRVFDAETGDELLEQWTLARIQDLAFIGNSRYLVTACEDSLLRVLDVDGKRELCNVALFTDNTDWVASAPDLRFDATENAIGKMYVVNGVAVTPLESLFDRLYTPKLVASLFAGEKIAPPSVDFSKLSPPPAVRLEFAEKTRNLVVEDDLPPNTVDRDAVQVVASASAAQAGLQEIRLFQNGKLITTAPVNGSNQKHTFDVSLLPGENTFRAVATNDQGTESRPAEVTIAFRPKTEAAAAENASRKPGGLQLHLLIVGVNAYKNPKYNLNYAVADAGAVKEKIQAQTKSIFTQVNVRFIRDDQAVKSSIADAFKELTAKAGARDVFVFYYAGHGVMTQEAKPEFYLVPHDVTQLYGADDVLRQKGISAAELQQLAKTMPAQKQLFILDACQSAGALTSMAMRGAAEEKAIAQLARSTGTHWLTASGSEQFATEFEQLGHGAFTYVLLEALSGKADTGDGRVTVNELKAYLEAQVPEVTQKYKGTPQFPSSYGFGQDFPVAVVTP